MDKKIKEWIKLINEYAPTSDNIPLDKSKEFIGLNKEEMNEIEDNVDKGGRVVMHYMIITYFEDISKKLYEKTKNFKILKADYDRLFSSKECERNPSAPIFESEKKYGFSWSFISWCNKKIGITLRDLGLILGCSKDTIRRYIKFHLEYVKLKFERLQLERELNPLKDRLKSLRDKL